VALKGQSRILSGARPLLLARNEPCALKQGSEIETSAQKFTLRPCGTIVTTLLVVVTSSVPSNTADITAHTRLEEIDEKTQ
jgi:hypothetical protein